jgi:deoxyadenosine/deoxycytidine kinase
VLVVSSHAPSAHADASPASGPDVTGPVHALANTTVNPHHRMQRVPSSFAQLSTGTRAETPDEFAPTLALRVRSRTVTRARYIAVAGNMGSGKSSLVHWLCQQFELSPFFEPHEENPYLADFYTDMKRWAFNSQLFFLARRFKIHRELEALGKPVVQDRTLYEDAEIFAEYLHRRHFIDARDWATYSDLYTTLRNDVRPPDVMIYLRCDLRTLRARIRMRGRAYEQSIPAEYLRALQGLYEEWFARYDLSPKLVLETDKLDYVTEMFDRQSLLDEISRRLR